MSKPVDQKSYLQKYLSGSSGDKKKKKKKVTKGKGFKIIDDDVDITKMRPLDGDELDIFNEGEDAPQVAGIIDERPEEIRKMEQFKMTSKWRVINQDDGFISKIQVQEIKKTIKEKQKENELVFGKMYSDSEEDKNNESDLSPPRKGNSSKDRNQTDVIHKRNLHSKKQIERKDEDSDQSPPRKREITKSKDRVRQSRWGSHENKIEIQELNQKRKNNSSTNRREDSDESSPRKSRKASPENHRKSHRKERNDNRSDSDISPPRKTKKHSPDRGKYLSDSDQSPPRNRKEYQRKRQTSPETSKHKSKSRRKSNDSDLSPPRKVSKHRQENSRSHKVYERNKRISTDSDISPPRNRKEAHYSRNRQNSDSPPPSNKKMAKTLEGKQAGLQDANQLRQESDLFRRKEEEAFKKMSDEVSGRNALAVSRKSGKRETSEERRKQIEKAERQKELDNKYKQWSRGLKQIQATEARLEDYIHESSKPLARYKDDTDIDRSLQTREREGDPMLQYIREKKVERGELPPERPTYKGNFPPNRFNIRPGYRWDGVDRSNGYEKKYFEGISRRKAQEEDAYKWSSADL